MLFRKNPTTGLSTRPEGSMLADATPPETMASEPTPRSPFADKGPEMNPTIKSPPPVPPTTSFKPTDAVPRRVVDIPGSAPRRPGTETVAPAQAPATDMRKLIVGRDISLSGEITACDVLVVEGNVEARLKDGRNIEIAESGLFKGSVEIDDADIAGRFEGDITVRGRLRVRSSGRITGNIRYGELEVEAGGRLRGDIQVIEMASGVTPMNPPVAAPRPAPTEVS
jgi:cytoskeletal protein CcmA (bactofilin family)